MASRKGDPLHPLEGHISLGDRRPLGTGTGPHCDRRRPIWPPPAGSMPSTSERQIGTGSGSGLARYEGLVEDQICNMYV